MSLASDLQEGSIYAREQAASSSTADKIFYKRGRWYNKAGHLLGHGDLSCSDILRLKNDIKEEDLFIVISAMDEWYKPSEDIPVEQLLKKSPLIISRTGVFFVTKSVENLEPETVRAGIKIKFSTPDTALRMLVCHV